jgi:hypothetical protein
MVNKTILLTQWHFAKRNIFTGKVALNSYLTHGLRHYCVIDQSATENKVIHTLIIDFFSHGLRSVKIEQELEKRIYSQICIMRSPLGQNMWPLKRGSIYMKVSMTVQEKCDLLMQVTS